MSRANWRLFGNTITAVTDMSVKFFERISTTDLIDIFFSVAGAITWWYVGSWIGNSNGWSESGFDSQNSRQLSGLVYAVSIYAQFHHHHPPPAAYQQTSMKVRRMKKKHILDLWQEKLTKYNLMQYQWYTKHNYRNRMNECSRKISLLNNNYLIRTDANWRLTKQCYEYSFYWLSADNLMLPGTLMANANDLHFISLLSYMKGRMSLQNILYNEHTNCIQFSGRKWKSFCLSFGWFVAFADEGRKRRRHDLFGKFYKPTDAAIGMYTRSAFTKVRFSRDSLLLLFWIFPKISHSKFFKCKTLLVAVRCLLFSFCSPLATGKLRSFFDNVLLYSLFLGRARASRTINFARPTKRYKAIH